jgi:hypothetical protein
MTATQHRSGGLDANARGLAVLGVALLVGFLLLLKAGDGGSAEAVKTAGGTKPTIDTSGLTDESTTTTPDDTTTSSSEPSGTTHDPSEVKVVVLNGSGLTGVAKSTSETVGGKGYQMLDPSNAAAGRVEATTVYYSEGYQSEAAAIAELLGKTADSVGPKPTQSLGTGSDKANVVVVLGKDTAPAGSTTTTTESSSTTTN